MDILSQEMEIRTSVNSIYNALLERQLTKAKEKEELKKKIKEEELEKEENEEVDKDKILTKKEKAQLALDNWKEVIVGLTGDDLDYVKEKKNKKKYRAWFSEDEELNQILIDKPKKRKKRNYNKEFEPELNMLKNIVADQNKFTTDLQKRYQNIVGPIGKDNGVMNKTIVELASVINASRGNSLSVLREIGNIKKTIADLYMKQRKLDSELGGGFDSQDLTLMGSSVASSLFSQDNFNQNTSQNENVSRIVPNTSMDVSNVPVASVIEEFNPDTWDGGGMDSGNAKYEAIPHSIVVEWHKNEDRARFKAVRDSDGSELVGANVPSCKIKSFDEKDKWAKDEFDQVYRLEIIE